MNRSAVLVLLHMVKPLLRRFMEYAEFRTEPTKGSRWVVEASREPSMMVTTEGVIPHP